MAAGRSRNRGIVGELASLIAAIFVIGGWWLHNGGGVQGLEGCIHDAQHAAVWVAELGADIFGDQVDDPR